MREKVDQKVDVSDVDFKQVNVCLDKTAYVKSANNEH